MCYREILFPVSASRAACRSLLAYVPYTYRGDEDPGAARGSSPGLVWAHPLPICHLAVAFLSLHILLNSLIALPAPPGPCLGGFGFLM